MDNVQILTLYFILGVLSSVFYAMLLKRPLLVKELVIGIATWPVVNVFILMKAIKIIFFEGR